MTRLLPGDLDVSALHMTYTWISSRSVGDADVGDAICRHYTGVSITGGVRLAHYDTLWSAGDD